MSIFQNNHCLYRKATMNPLVVKLSCDECRQRKTKCDKGSPCSACKHAGTNCTTVQRARHPRGRSGNTKKRTVLETRVAQLEDLVKQLGVSFGSSESSFVVYPNCLVDANRKEQ